MPHYAQLGAFGVTYDITIAIWNYINRMGVIHLLLVLMQPPVLST